MCPGFTAAPADLEYAHAGRYRDAVRPHDIDVTGHPAARVVVNGEPSGQTGPHRLGQRPQAAGELRQVPDQFLGQRAPARHQGFPRARRNSKR